MRVKRSVAPDAGKKGEKKSVPVVVIKSPFGEVGVLKSDFDRVTEMMKGADGGAFARVVIAMCGGKSPAEMAVFMPGMSATDAAFRDGARVFLQLVLSLNK